MRKRFHHKEEMTDAEEMIRWLNSISSDGDDAGPYAEVSTLINLLAMGASKYLDPKRKLQMIDRANHDLADCLSVPRVEAVPGKEIVVSWIPDAKAEKWEQDRTRAFYKVILLFERGILPRIRQCAYEPCRRWFFAKNRKRRFHSESCNKSASLQKPEVLSKQKATHLTYMRRTRWETRLRDAISVESISATFSASRGKAFQAQLQDCVKSGVAAVMANRKTQKIGLSAKLIERLALGKLQDDGPGLAKYRNPSDRAEAVARDVKKTIVDVAVPRLLEKKYSATKGAS